MKINKAKLLVGTLAVVATAATVGSISGTVAWFQYNTRSTVEYSGASAHCSESLQVKIGDGNWKSDLSIDDINGYLDANRYATDNEEDTAAPRHDHLLYPITTGNSLANAKTYPTTFYKNPIYQYSGAYSTTNHAWRSADLNDWIELPLQFRVVDVNGGRTAGGDYNTFLAKKIYLSDLAIADGKASGKLDISPAIRVAFDGDDNDGVFSLDGVTAVTTGALDLNGDGKTDKEAGYSWDNPGDYTYGTAESTAPSQKIETYAADVDLTDDTDPMKLANDTDPLNIVGKELCTSNDDGSAVTVKVRIYLEGWQGLAKNGTVANKAALADVTSPSKGDSYRAADTGKIWKRGDSDWEEDTVGEKVWSDKDFVGASFNIGMRFTAEAHTDQHA